MVHKGQETYLLQHVSLDLFPIPQGNFRDFVICKVEFLLLSFEFQQKDVLIFVALKVTLEKLQRQTRFKQCQNQYRESRTESQPEQKQSGQDPTGLESIQREVH